MVPRRKSSPTWKQNVRDMQAFLAYEEASRLHHSGRWPGGLTMVTLVITYNGEKTAEIDFPMALR